ncbi:hypothetical protein [Embleya hyalina]|uniref:DUF98 domain-containing protein n=1 Tax=Embleya hyalina TaxID=516124 RepID=A0A401YWW2_9ACTN|nr:hypothetical protein [Embleya hyalina]GCD99104.1 hypothetical protein EHYA_06816 [Embleya hyalina]
MPQTSPAPAVAPPPGRCPRGPDSRIARFASPATRMLLAGDGLTTVLLQAVLRVPLGIRTDSIEQARASVLGDTEAVSALRVPGRRPCWSRHSRLLTPDGATVSFNRVVAPTARDPRVDAAMADPEQPLGFALNGAGLTTVRQLHGVGRVRWPAGTGRLCAFKTYTLHGPGGVLAFVHERYSPDWFSAAVDAPAG